MSSRIHEKLLQESREEPFGRLLGMEVIEVGSGSALVNMIARPELGNVFGRTHGGALFSLIDEAFQLACNSHGILSVALNVSITFVSVPVPGCLLEAQALAYRTGKRLGLS